MAKCTLNRVHILFISAAIAEGGIFTSGLVIVIVLWGNTPYSLYNISRASLFPCSPIPLRVKQSSSTHKCLGGDIVVLLQESVWRLP